MVLAVVAWSSVKAQTTPDCVAYKHHFQDMASGSTILHDRILGQCGGGWARLEAIFSISAVASLFLTLTTCLRDD